MTCTDIAAKTKRDTSPEKFPCRHEAAGEVQVGVRTVHSKNLFFGHKLLLILGEINAVRHKRRRVTEKMKGFINAAIIFLFGKELSNPAEFFFIFRKMGLYRKMTAQGELTEGLQLPGRAGWRKARCDDRPDKGIILPFLKQFTCILYGCLGVFAKPGRSIAVHADFAKKGAKSFALQELIKDAAGVFMYGSENG